MGCRWKWREGKKKKTGETSLEYLCWLYLRLCGSPWKWKINDLNSQTVFPLTVLPSVLLVHAPLYGSATLPTAGMEKKKGTWGWEATILNLMWQLLPNNGERWKNGADVASGNVASATLLHLFLEHLCHLGGGGGGKQICPKKRKELCHYQIKILLMS